MSNAKDFVYCPISELPNDADPIADRPARFGFGSDVFGGSSDWIIYENGTSPTRVYKIPAPITKLLKYLFDRRFVMGQQDAMRKIRDALGIKD